jgi:hypothetical protein
MFPESMEPVTVDDRGHYARDLSWLQYVVHELPAGILFGANGASPDECRELMEGLDEFARLCLRLQLTDHAEFIENCRWHFEHYPHYLGRRRHFHDYESYIRDRHGPLVVTMPPSPPWLARA